jgi:hypothetical protein
MISLKYLIVTLDNKMVIPSETLRLGPGYFRNLSNIVEPNDYFYGLERENLRTMKYQCKNCRHIFEGEGIKTEYTDPVFGACSKYIAECPECKEEAVEYRKPKPVKIADDYRGPACGSGDCCCMN